MSELGLGGIFLFPTAYPFDPGKWRKAEGKQVNGGYGSWFLVALLAVQCPLTRSLGRKVRWPGPSARRSSTLCSASQAEES